MSEKGSEDSPSRPKRKITLRFDSSSDSDDSETNRICEIYGYTARSRRKRLRVLSDKGSGSSVVCAEKGSEDSPSRPKRKIKKVMVLSSDSSSDSDDSVAVARSRRRRLWVTKQASTRDDSVAVARSRRKRLRVTKQASTRDDSVAVARSRRKRLRVRSDKGSGSSVGAWKFALRRLRDSRGDNDTPGWATTTTDTSDSGTDTSDSGTDTSDWATNLSDAPKPASSATEPASGFASDSSEGNSDKCSICLLRFADQEVGTPQSCEHIFCLDCITEWSKNVNTCPVDRMTFDFIVVRACAGGRVLRTEPVKVVEPRPSVEFLNLWNLTVCEVCGRRDSEETMLVCLICDCGYHMQCLTPPLSEVRNELIDWLCPNCHFLPNLFRSALIRERRYIRSRMSSADEPSTSSGNSGRRLNSDDIPTISRGTHSAQGSSSRTTRKFPVTKRVKRKLKKRRTKRRQPSTAARRFDVRVSMRTALEF